MSDSCTPDTTPNPSWLWQYSTGIGEDSDFLKPDNLYFSSEEVRDMKNDILELQCATGGSLIKFYIVPTEYLTLDDAFDQIEDDNPLIAVVFIAQGTHTCGSARIDTRNCPNLMQVIMRNDVPAYPNPGYDNPDPMLVDGTIQLNGNAKLICTEIKLKDILFQGWDNGYYDIYDCETFDSDPCQVQMWENSRLNWAGEDLNVNYFQTWRQSQVTIGYDADLSYRSGGGRNQLQTWDASTLHVYRIDCWDATEVETWNCSKLRAESGIWHYGTWLGDNRELLSTWDASEVVLDRLNNHSWYDDDADSYNNKPKSGLALDAWDHSLVRINSLSGNVKVQSAATLTCESFHNAGGDSEGCFFKDNAEFIVETIGDNTEIDFINVTRVKAERVGEYSELKMKGMSTAQVDRLSSTINAYDMSDVRVHSLIRDGNDAYGVINEYDQATTKYFEIAPW